MKRVTYVNLILGIWLLWAPFVFGTFAVHRLAGGNEIALGVLLVATSWWIVAAKTAQIPVGGLQLLCGIWLLVGPFTLRYTGLARATLNDVISGALVVIVSVLETWTLWRAPIKAV